MEEQHLYQFAVITPHDSHCRDSGTSSSLLLISWWQLCVCAPGKVRATQFILNPLRTESLCLNSDQTFDF